MDDDGPVTARATQGGPPGAPDPWDEDWLAETDADELEWFPAADGRPTAGRAAPPAARGRQPAKARPAGPVPAGAPDILRGHGAMIALLVVVVLAVVVAIYVFGSSGGGSNPPATTAGTTPPATTPSTTPSTTPATTPGSATTSQTTTQTNTNTTTTNSTALKVTLPAAGHLKAGDTGTEVATVQKALTQLGIAQLTADGNYGPATAQAVTAFQQAHGLTADGVVGAETANAINQALAAQG